MKTQGINRAEFARQCRLTADMLLFFILAALLVTPPAAYADSSEWYCDNFARYSFDPSGRWKAKIVRHEALGLILVFPSRFSTYLDDDEGWVWDGERAWDSDVWYRVSLDGPHTREGPAMAYDPIRQEILLFGGMDEDATIRGLGDTWAWDGIEWRLVSETGPSPRTGACMAFDQARGEMILFGGQSSSDLYGDTWAWNGTEWRQVAENGPAARDRAAMTYHIRRQMIVMTGGRISGTDRMTWAWDGTEWTSIDAGFSAGWLDASMTYDTARDKVVMIGGDCSTWELENAQWVDHTISDGGPSRFEDSVKCGVTFDPATSLTLVFGDSTTPNGQFWGWDGTAWQLVGPTSLPVGLAYTAEADCAPLQGVLLHGGERDATGGQQYGAHLWLWRNGVWRVLSDSGPSRHHHSMAFDERRGRLVVFGGVNEAGEKVNDTWEWDGQAWLQVATNGPAPGHNNEMVFDSRRGVVVLVNGDDPRVSVWEWNGVEWQEGPPSFSPDPRYNFRIAYDPVQAKTILFAGQHNDYGGWYRDTWMWDGLQWILDNGPNPAARTYFGMAYDAGRRKIVALSGQLFRTTQWELENGRWRIIGCPPWLNATRMTYDSTRDRMVDVTHDYVEEFWKDFSIVRQPEHLTADVGGRAVFQCRLRADGTAPMRWLHDGHPLADDGRITGTETRTLIIDPIEDDDDGVYELAVAPTCQSVFRSNPAVLDLKPLAITINTDCTRQTPSEIRWSGATPVGRVMLLSSRSPGAGIVPPGLLCVDLPLGIRNSDLTALGVFETDEFGAGAATGMFGPGACGRYVQAVDVENCSVSAVVRVE